MDSTGNASDLLDDFREETETPSPVTEEERKNQFLPWHKPRKQYVRRYQWCDALEKMLAGGRWSLNGRSLSYLGLPGDDMLDVRSLHSVCARKNVRLRYLGFNAVRESRSTESHLSHNELRSQAYSFIDAENSEILLDPLEGIVSQGSMSYKSLLDRAPYDIVNFDLCDSVAKSNPAVEESTIQALRVILETQRETCSSPWLLFLTTRVNREQTNEAVRSKIGELLDSNVSASERFRSLFSQSVRRSQLGKFNAYQERLSEDFFSRSFVVGFCKWLVSVAASGDPKWAVHLDSVRAYTIMGSLDMYSLVFCMEKLSTPGRDRIGWTRDVGVMPGGTFGQAAIDEVGVACRAVEEVFSTQTDIDALLNRDGELRAAVVSEAAKLLEEARYDSAAYHAWVDAGCIATRDVSARASGSRSRSSHRSRK